MQALASYAFSVLFLLHTAQCWWGCCFWEGLHKMSSNTFHFWYVMVSIGAGDGGLLQSMLVVLEGEDVGVHLFFL
jgi:hypothetical protein